MKQAASREARLVLDWVMMTLKIPLGLLLIAGLAGCGEVPRLADCVNICDAYRTCADASYDTAACATRCEDQSDFDPSYEQKARDCESCVNARSCSTTFPCGGECAGIVP